MDRLLIKKAPPSLNVGGENRKGTKKGGDAHSSARDVCMT